MKAKQNSQPAEQEERHGTRIAVRPAEKSMDRSKKNDDRNKKPRPRRDKLKELNNIIRDLQRDVTNDDDLVISEVCGTITFFRTVNIIS
jgi:hypothetical protein